MPFVLANGSAKLAYHFKLASDPEDMIVTFGVRSIGTPDAGELGAIYDAWNDMWTANMSSEYTFRGFTMVGKTSSGVDYETEFFSNAAGGTAGTFLPQNTALLVQKRTGLPGRANRGRIYIPGILQGSQVDENGTVHSADVGTYQTAATDFKTALENEGLTGVSSIVILHPDGTYTDVTALVVDDVVATQRRRLR